MNKKFYPIVSIIVMVLYFIVELIGNIIDGDHSIVPAVLFTGVMSLLVALSVLPERYRKVRMICLILVGIEFLCAAVASVTVFIKFSAYPFAIKVVFLLLLVGLNTGLLLVETKGSIFLTKIISAISTFVLISLVAAAFDNFASNVFTASINMTCAAISLNTMTSKLNGNIKQAIISIASLVLLILPVIFLIRGYWDFSTTVTFALSIGSVVIALVCTIISSVIELKKLKNEVPDVIEDVETELTSFEPQYMNTAPVMETVAVKVAPAPAVELVTVETWICERCGADKNTGGFCEECGEKKLDYWFCTSCGTKNHKQFCGKCGQKREQ